MDKIQERRTYTTKKHRQIKRLLHWCTKVSELLKPRYSIAWLEWPDCEQRTYWESTCGQRCLVDLFDHCLIQNKRNIAELNSHFPDKIDGLRMKSPRHGSRQKLPHQSLRIRKVCGEKWCPGLIQTTSSIFWFTIRENSNAIKCGSIPQWEDPSMINIHCP